MQLANVRRNAIGVAALTVSIGSGLLAPSAWGQTTPPAPPASGTGAPAAPVVQESAFFRGMRIFADPSLGPNNKQSDAIPLLTQAVSEEPKNGDALTTLGYLEAQAGHYDLAIGYLERAILIPNRAQPASALMNLAVALTTRPDSQPGDRARAIELLEKATNLLDPEPRTAESAAAIVTANDPAAFNAQMALGRVAAQAGDDAKAANAFQRATLLDSGNAIAWSSLGISLYHLKREPEAITALRKATGLFESKNSQDTKDAQIYAMLGNLELKQEDSDDKAAGRKDIETALRINKDDPVVQSIVGAFYTDERKPVEAAASYGLVADQLETDIKGSPDGATPAQRKQLGSLRYRQGLELSRANHTTEISAQAIDAYKKAIAADPDNVEAMINCGALLYGAGRFDDAISYDNMALKKNPSPQFALTLWRNLALAYDKKHNDAKAELAWNAVLKIDPDNTDALKGKAADIVDANPIDDAAVPVYKKLARLKPEDAEPMLDLGLLYERQVPYFSTAAAKQVRLLEALHCFTEAIKRGTAAAANDPVSHASYNVNTATAYNDRGVIHEQLAESTVREQSGEIAKAKADYKKALELNPNFEEARKNIDRFTTPPTTVVKANGKRY